MTSYRIAFLSLILLALLAAPAIAQKAENTAVVPVPREGARWTNRHQAMNERVAKGNVDLLMIGDSITQGWEGAGRKVWEKYYGSRSAVNLGIGGDRTQHVIWRLQNGNLEGIEPKLAVIMIGTNNSCDNTGEEIAAGVTEIVELLNKELPETKVLVLGIFPRGATPDDPRRKVNEAANKIIAKLGEREKVTYLDIGDEFLADDGTLTREVMPDLLHLNEKSYQTWAEAIEPEVSKVLGKLE